MNEELIEALAAQAREEGLFSAPQPHRVKYRPFRPRLNPIQGKAYDSKARYNLVYGERFSGKTYSALHKLVHFCRENRNGLALVIVGVKRQAEEHGAWYKLLYQVLPEWEHGCGVEATPPKTNTAKDIFIWISNRWGGWSRVVLLSMPVEGFVPDRVKGMEPGFVMVDEAQTLGSDAYFSAIVQQLGRDPETVRPQIYYCANPAGPSHWLYKRFFEYPVTLYEDGTQHWDERYFVQHVPISDNEHNLPAGYWESVIEATRHDDTEYRRMVLGEWVDAPTGEALFREDFVEALHVRGDARAGTGIVPVKGLPIVEGWDLGAAHSSIHLMQIYPHPERVMWLVFDEVVLVDQYVPYPKLVPEVLGRRDYWKQRGGFDFPFISISDNSAFNQFRAATGSFDAADVQRLSGGKIRLWECPKGPGSVETRVRLLKEKLNIEKPTIVFSASCARTKEMLLNLEADKDQRMKPKRSRFLHPFDSLTYPQLYYGMQVRAVPEILVERVEPEFYACGRG